MNRPRHWTEPLGGIVRRQEVGHGEEASDVEFAIECGGGVMAKSQGRQDIFGIVRRVLRWKSTLLDRTAEFFEDGRAESAAGTRNEHCAEFGRLQVELG